MPLTRMSGLGNALLYLLGVVVGIGLHWTVKWLNREVKCLWDMARTAPRRTAAAMLAQILASTGVIATGSLDTVSAAAAVAAGVMQGGAVDALVNRGIRRK